MLYDMDTFVQMQAKTFAIFFRLGGSLLIIATELYVPKTFLCVYRAGIKIERKQQTQTHCYLVKRKTGKDFVCTMELLAFDRYI